MFDLRTSKPHGKIPAPQRPAHQPDRALSPDGNHHVFCYRIDNTPIMDIADTQTGKTVVVKLADTGVPMTKWCEFLDNKRFAWAGHLGPFKGLMMFDTETGQKTHEVAVPDLFETAALTLDRTKLAWPAATG